MSNASRFHRGFPLDLAAATEYYDNISYRLGDRFRDSVEQMLKTICERPESFGFVSGRLRAAMVRSFPYVILYRLVNQTIFFVGLFHAASDPKCWSERDEQSETA